MSRFTVTVRTEPLCEGASANNKGCSGESVALLTTVDISTITHLCSIQVRRMGTVCTTISTWTGEHPISVHPFVLEKSCYVATVGLGWCMQG